MTFRREDSAGYLTNWTARLFARAIDRHLRPMGVSSGMLPIFFALGNGASLSQKALTALAAIEQPTMAGTLARMERDGLIERRPDPADRRSQLVALTPAAMVKAAKVKQAVDAANALALGDLAASERALYHDLLRRVAAALEKALAEEP